MAVYSSQWLCPLSPGTSGRVQIKELVCVRLPLAPVTNWAPMTYTTSHSLSFPSDTYRKRCFLG